MRPRPKCDFFIDHEGQTLLAEVWETDGDHVIDYSLSLVLEDGSTDLIDDEELWQKLLDKVNERYYEWATAPLDDDVF